MGTVVERFDREARRAIRSRSGKTRSTRANCFATACTPDSCTGWLPFSSSSPCFLASEFTCRGCSAGSLRSSVGAR